MRTDEIKIAPPSTQLPAGLPAWITVEAVEDTLRTFQPFYTEAMTVDDAIGMLLNVGNMFGALKDNLS